MARHLFGLLGKAAALGLAALAAECRGLHLPFDENVIHQRIQVLRSALAEIG